MTTGCKLRLQPITHQQTKVALDLYRESYHVAVKNASTCSCDSIVDMVDTNEVHFDGKIAQKAIIVKGNKVLLLRDPRMEQVIWEIPGGRMNIDEEPREAVAREIREELGVAINVGEVVYMEQFIQSNERRRAFVIVYKASLVDEEADFVLLAEEVCEIAWVAEDELVNYELFPAYTRALDCYFANYSK